MNHVPQQSPKELERAVMQSRTDYESLRAALGRRKQTINDLEARKAEALDAARQQQEAAERQRGGLIEAIRGKIRAGLTKGGSSGLEIDNASKLGEIDLSRGIAATKMAQAKLFADVIEEEIQREREHLAAEELLLSLHHRAYKLASSEKCLAEVCAKLAPLLRQLSMVAVMPDAVIRELIASNGRPDHVVEFPQLTGCPFFSEVSGLFGDECSVTQAASAGHRQDRVQEARALLAAERAA